MEAGNDLLAEFVLEAKSHIEEIEAGLLRMEEGEDDDDTINSIFRAAHSIKGTASFFELNKIVELGHSIETLFGEIRDRRLGVSPAMIDVLLSATDRLKELLQDPQAGERLDISATVSEIQRLLTAPQGKAPKQEQPASKSAASVSAWDLWNQLTAGEQPAATAVEEPAVSQQAASIQPASPAVALPDTKSREVVMEDSVRVSVGLLNDLLNLAGEMVLRRNQLLRLAQDSGRQIPQLEVVTKGIDELTTNLQKKVMKARMQPIANVFNKFPRIVRDLSRKVGKEVDLVMQGMNVELDRSLIEALVDPMTHLVRNALDHGIEPPDIRKASGKPLAGSLVLHAYHESGRVVVEVSDDGAGISLEKVRAKAVQKGIVSEKDSARMSDSDIVNLIMAPGFSTAEQVTDISGRGVGMDVVKTNIEKLGGKIEISSEAGKGTTFQLTLPLTLAIISSLVVMADGQFFAIPQTNVRELLLIQPGESGGKRITIVRGRPVLRLRERLLPLVRLADILAKAAGDSPAEDIIDDQQILRILVIKAGTMDYGLVVDSVCDTEEILVKPISAVLSSSGLYSGVTVLGDGSVAMILDTERLRYRVGFTLTQDSFLPAGTGAAKNIAEEKQYLLLFRGSGSEILGLDLAMVSRIEEVDISRIQKIGAKYYFSFQGQTTQVIRPEQYLPITAQQNNVSKIYVILPKLVKHSVGIIAEEIFDALYTTVVLDKDGVRGTGILGSALINDTLVTLVNMYELFAEAVPEYYTPEPGRRRKSLPDGTAMEERGITILLAEDTPFFLKLVKSYLEGEGYDVIAAENGRQAYELLTKTNVDIVVSDIEMPVMTGIELVRAIRANEKFRQLPVIALTSLTGDAHKEKGLRAGFDIYEYKLDRGRLLESIRCLLENGRQAGGE